MTRSRVALGLLALVTAGGVAALLVAGRGSGDDAGEARARPDANQVQIDSLTQLPLEPSRGPRLEGMASDERALHGNGARWLLRVHLIGLPPGMDEPARVSVESHTCLGRDGGVLEASSTSSPIVLDASSAMRRPAEHWLVVSASAPLCLPIGRRVVEVLDDEHARAKGGVIDVDLTLTPVAVLRGRMIGPDGLPRAGLVQVIADPRLPSSELKPASKPESVQPDGLFECRVVGRTHAALALRAAPPETESPPLLPGLAGPWHVTAGTITDVGDVRLEPGLALEGRIEGSAVNQVSVSAQLFSSAWFAGPDTRRWGLTPEGPVERIFLRTHGETEFALQPLLRGTWQVEAHSHFSAIDSHELRWDARRLVEVPSDPLVLDMRRSLLRVTVTGAGEPLNEATVVLEAGEDALALRPGYAVAFRPFTRLRVFAWAAGHTPRSEPVTTPPDGELRQLSLDLEPAPSARQPPEGWEWAIDPQDQLEVTLSSRSGLRVDARLRLLDQNGLRAPATWIERDEDEWRLVVDGHRATTPVPVTWRTDGRLVGFGPAKCVSKLPPGPLTLEVEAPGHVTRRVELTGPARAEGVRRKHTVVLELR